VDINKIERQIRVRLGRIAQKLCEIRQSAACIRDRRRTDLDPSREGLHVIRISLDRLGHGHVRGLAVEVRVGLVEAEEGVGAVVKDAEVDVGGPDGGERGGVVVEQREEAVGWGWVGVEADVVGGIGEGVVVVGPGDVRARWGPVGQGCYIGVG
jgi:hypothetical protein